MNRNLFIPKTSYTPEFFFMATGECVISGDSRTESLDDLYIIAKEYLKKLIDEKVQIKMTFFFNYYNTLAQRYVFDVLEILSKQKSPEPVIWKYKNNDETIEDMGYVYKNSFPELNIKMKEV